MRGKSQWIALSLFLVLTMLVPTAPALAAERLPDLGMARIKDVAITIENGRRLLRFTTRIVNIGMGTFELMGSRPDLSTSDMTTVIQRVYNDAGGYTDYSIPTTMFYAGDGHNHWHLRDLQNFALNSLGGSQIGTGAKTGFCVYDNVNYFSMPGHPASPVYLRANSCSPEQPSALETRVGLSIGWGDRYLWSLAYQYIDITGVPAGQYQLDAGVNTALGLHEISQSNNSTWVKLQLNSDTGTDFVILGYGPSVLPEYQTLLPIIIGA